LAAAVTPTNSFASDRTPVAEETPGEGKFPSAAPRYRFGASLKEQEAQLKTNPLMLRFARSRQRLANDRYRPLYHFVSPEGGLNDPNGLSFWQGRWHLFYQALPPEEKHRPHWGHAVSDDLVHWRDLPYAIYPGIGQYAASGGTVVEPDRVVAFYPEVDAGQMIAISRDPLLLNWEKSGPADTARGDSDIWKEGDTYFGLVGGMRKYYADSSTPASALGGFFEKVPRYAYGHGVWPSPSVWSSRDLRTWKSEGDLILEPTPLTDRYDEASCPNFLPIGDRHILLFFSHKNGGQYFLGDYNGKTHRFKPYDHGRFNHGQVAPAGVHAPSASPDGSGGVINILNINKGKPQGGEIDRWDHPRSDHLMSHQIMSLPQRLTLGGDKKLRIEPVEAVKRLRGPGLQVSETQLPADAEVVLQSVRGNAMELDLEIDPRDAHWIRLNVLRSATGEEQTSITLYTYTRGMTSWLGYDVPDEVVLDASQSSTLKDAWSRPPERAQFRRGSEALKLRVFIDRSVVEVFVNGQQYLATRVYPGRDDSTGVSLRSHGGSALLKGLDAWQMKPIWPTVRSAS